MLNKFSLEFWQWNPKSIPIRTFKLWIWYQKFMFLIFKMRFKNHNFLKTQCRFKQLIDLFHAVLINYSFRIMNRNNQVFTYFRRFPIRIQIYKIYKHLSQRHLRLLCHLSLGRQPLQLFGKIYLKFCITNRQ